MKKLIYSLLSLVICLSSCMNNDNAPDNGTVKGSTATHVNIDVVNGSTKGSSLVLRFYYLKDGNKNNFFSQTITDKTYNQWFDLSTGKGTVVFSVQTSMKGTDEGQLTVNFTHEGRTTKLEGWMQFNNRYAA
jgi:hypothetical protein